jgi:hypothetical protein
MGAPSGYWPFHISHMRKYPDVPSQAMRLCHAGRGESEKVDICNRQKPTYIGFNWADARPVETARQPGRGVL